MDDIYEDDGYLPGGQWKDEGHGWMSYVPNELQSNIFPKRDLVAMVSDKVGTWQIYCNHFTDGREACLLAGRIKIFHSGVKVVKQEGKFYILCWNTGGTNNV